ncbi:MAG TPA: PfkB family carbohydrate kinase [Candidatus Limnocylindria bacterium]|nr:PfkB family carbohydrate kinase [Candidatus Limnocylindria bacterium]
MDRKRLLEIISGFGGARVAVLGDLFLDKWLTVDRRLDEPSLETGLTAWQVVGMRSSPGAAGTVIGNLAALGAGKVSSVSFVGKDGEGWELLRGLKERGVDTRLVTRSARRMTPAYVKPMFTGGSGPEEEGNRIDVRNRTATPDALQRALARGLRSLKGTVDALVVLDQVWEEDTGVVTAAMREEVARFARENPEVRVFADSRAHIGLFRDVTVKCNQREAALATGMEPGGAFPEGVFACMDALRGLTGRAAFVTCGEHGIACEEEGRKAVVPAVRQTGPIDICGAGDAAMAGIALATCAGASPMEAAFVGNLASGVTVRKIGTTGTVSQQEMLALFDEQSGS